MADIINISDFKTILEWKEFAEKQFLTIQFLQSTIDKLNKEVDQLRNTQFKQSPVEKIIVSPEQALLDDQILMIQQRAYMKELNLEDVKKLDILLKHQRQLKQDAKLLEGKFKPINLSKDELLLIAQGSNGTE